MRTKHRCVLIHIRNKDVDTVKYCLSLLSVLKASFVDCVCYLCFKFIFVVMICLFLAALSSPARKGLTSWLSGI